MLKCTYCKDPIPECPHCRGPGAQHYLGQKWYCSRECLNKMRVKQGKEPVADDKIVIPFVIPL